MNSSTRSLEMIHRLNQELGWHLDAQEQERYATKLQQHLPEHYSKEQLRSSIIYYHLEHRLVESLQDPQHPDYEARWTSWVAQVLTILRRAGLNWTGDMLFEEEDLVQVALIALANSIDSYHFASRFSTWAHRVIVQSVQRTIRDSQALKRASRPESLDQSTQVDATINDMEQPELAAAAHVLAERVIVILEKQANQRLAQIFRLWAVEDLRVEEIGRIMHLHPSRIRVLLQEARQILREASEIQSWSEDNKNINEATSSLQIKVDHPLS